MQQQRIPIWFDIDGTLLFAHSAGRNAFERAMEEHFGWESGLEGVSFAGATDLQVLADLARFHGACPEQTRRQAPAFFQRMREHLHAGLEAQKPTPVKGAKELVRVLSKQAPVLLGLVTGNARHCAFVKLEHAGLGHYFDHGGFGCQHPDRDELARLARSEAATVCGSEEMLALGVIIGDTPRDVKAAKAIGAKSLGVASGAYEPEDLAAAGAERVVNHLSPDDELVHWLLSD